MGVPPWCWHHPTVCLQGQRLISSKCSTRSGQLAKAYVEGFMAPLKFLDAHDRLGADLLQVAGPCNNAALERLFYSFLRSDGLPARNTHE